MTPSATPPGPVVPRPVKGLALVSLSNDFASEMVYPLLPAFVTQTLGGGAVALGALDGAADLTAGLVRWVSGTLADRPGWRKPLVLAGYGAAVLVRPLMAVTSAAWQVIGFRVVDRIGKGLRTPARDAMIAGLTPESQRGRAFGFNRAADHLGAVAGSLAAWFLLRQAVPVRTVIGWSAIPGLLVLVVLAFVLRAAPRTAPRGGARRGPDASAADALGAAFWTPTLALVALTAGRLPETLLLLRLQDVGVAVTAIPLLWAGLHVVRSGFAYPGGWLTDRIGPRRMVFLGGLVFAVTLFGLAAATEPFAASAAFMSYGVVAGLTEAAERSVVARLAPVRTGRGFGIVQGLSAILALPVGLAFGIVYQGAGGPIALLASALVLVTGSVGWWLASRSA